MKTTFISFILLCFVSQFTFSQQLLSEGKTAWASSQEGAGERAENGNDGNLGTRWASDWSGDADPANAWWAVDLGKEYHVSRIEFDWQAAFAKEYQLQLSNDELFTDYEIIAHVKNGKGESETISTDLNKKGRYVRMQGIERGTGYGYSFHECRVYGMETLRQVDLKMEIPYVEYLKVKLTPADLTGKSELVIQNKAEAFDLKYNEGSPLKVEVLEFEGDFGIGFYTLKEGSETDSIKGDPLEVFVYENMLIGALLTPLDMQEKGLISQGKTSWASSIDGNYHAKYGNDGDSDTRFASKHNEDDAWWAVDLGSAYHVSRVEIDWEGAFGKKYQIQLSNDKEFNSFDIIADINNGEAGNLVHSTDLNKKGRYVRMRGIECGTGYGYSFYEFRVYGMKTLKEVPVTMEVPYVQYLKVRLTPADLNGKSELIIQNKDEIINLRYNEGSPLRVDLLDFRGNFEIDFFNLEKGSTTDSIKGVPLNTTVYENMVVGVKLTPVISFGNQKPVADAGPDI